MKGQIETLRGRWFFPALLLAGPAAAPANDWTAFELIQEGHRSVGEPAGDQVVQIRHVDSIR